MPLTHVAEFLPWEPEAVQHVDGRAVIELRGELIPVLDLRRLLLYRGEAPPARRPALVFEANGQRDPLLQALYTESLVNRRDVDTIDRLPQTGAAGAALKEKLAAKLVEHSRYIREHGQDMPEIRSWRWKGAAS